MLDAFDIRKIKQGDNDAFQHFFTFYYPKLMVLACRFVDEHIAKDLVQDVFITFWESKKMLEIDNIQSFLYKCLQNHCLNHLKHQTVISEYESLSQIAEERSAFWSERTDMNDVMTYVMTKNIREIIISSADKLPPKCRQAFLLCYFHDMSHKQIAEIMDISVRTVETHIRQAISFLRIDLKDLLIMYWLLSSYAPHVYPHLYPAIS